MKKVLIVLNYKAGRKKAVFLKKTLLKFLLRNCQKYKFVSIENVSMSDINDYDTIFAVGGDGTISQVVNAIMYSGNTEKNLAVIPCGTANLFASKLGLSSNLNKTLKIISKNNIKKSDVLNINGKYCLLRFGLGYDSDIICKTPQSLKNIYGYFAYFIAGIIFAFRLKYKTYEIQYDNETLITKASCLIIANAPNMYKNAVSIANNSQIDDGFFDIFILKTKNPIIFFLEFLRILFGIRKNNSRALYLQAKQARIQNNWNVCHIDGEKIKLKDDIIIRLISNVLNVYSA